MNRRALCFGAVGCATIALGGCATAVTAVTTVDEPQERTSTETVSSILVTEDKKTIVFLGKSYTYVFEAPVELISAFSASFYSALSANMHFLVRDDRFGEFINARIVLTVADSASAEQKEAAIAAGYQKSPVTGFNDANGKFQFSDSLYSLTVRFKGKRFGATDITGMQLQKLNRTYMVKVTEFEIVTGKTQPDDEPSPLRRGLNGILFLGALALYGLGMGLGIVK